MKIVHIGKALPKSWQPPKALPKTLGPCIDMLVQARAARKELEAEAESVKQQQKRIEDHIINTFEKQKINGARGKLGSVTLKEKDVPHIEDYEAFCEYVKKNDAWDLFTKRAHETASQARWDAGEEIDGLVKFHKVDLSLTEVK